MEGSGLKPMEDYVAFYDSTMARFWSLTSRGRSGLRALLAEQSCGTLLSDRELEQLGCLFPDRRFGDTIFVLNQGQLIVPSYMGRKPIAGMHGYLPDAPASSASLLSSAVPGRKVDAITDMYELMRSDVSRGT